MRIYEFAKKAGISSKELLALLKQNGFSFETHMSILTPEALLFLEKKPSSTNQASSSNNLQQKIDSNNNSKSVEKNTMQNQKSSSTPKEKKPRIIEDEFAPVLEEIELDSAYKHIKKSEDSPLFSKIKKSETKVAAPLKPLSRTPRRKEEKNQPQVLVPKNEIIVSSDKYLFEVAEEMGRPASELILALLKTGVVCNRNQMVSVDIIKKLAKIFGISVIEASTASQAFEKTTITQGADRWPVVVVMGHVDHGKTTLLDYIRRTNVAQREKGGITQHLGAHEVDSSHGKIVFLDTPGHAAFVNMRKRGARVTDIAILVVAADDGVMPQTIEALKNAQEAKIPVIVAVNKIDKVPNREIALETIKRQLSNYNLLPEDWGGDTIYVPLSAKTGEGVTDLLEMIILQSQIMELKAYADKPGTGIVLESSLEKGYGPVANVLFLEGSVKIGDFFRTGSVTGKVRFIFNEKKEKLQNVGPSTPVQLVGFDEMPIAGNSISVVSYNEYLSVKNNVTFKQPYTSASLFESQKKNINILLKADAYGSVEVALESIKQLSQKNPASLSQYNIISHGIGDVSEGDVAFAYDTEAFIIALHVKVERNAALYAKNQGVAIVKHDIIYRLLEELEERLQKDVPVTLVSKKTGDAVVLKVFNIKGVGIVIGGAVKNGIFTRTGKAVCIRQSKKVGEGKITSLQRNKASVKEVHAGFEFAFACDGFQDWQEGDIVECYVESPAA